MNTIEHEPLFTDLTPEEAAILAGGVETYCPYTTRGVNDWLNIRSSPAIRSDNIVGRWNPGQVKYLQSPAILKNGFRAFDSLKKQWVSTQYIQRSPGRCVI